MSEWESERGIVELIPLHTISCMLGLYVGIQHESVGPYFPTSMLHKRSEIFQSTPTLESRRGNSLSPHFHPETFTQSVLGVAYLLCTLVYHDKNCRYTWPRSTSKPGPSVGGWEGGGGEGGGGGGTVDSDMQKCLFCSSETSLAYHVSPPARIYIWTLKKHFKRRQQHQRLKKKKSSPPVLAGVFWAEPTAGKPQKNKKINSWSRDIIRPFPSRFHWLKEKYADNV